MDRKFLLEKKPSIHPFYIRIPFRPHVRSIPRCASAESPNSTCAIPNLVDALFLPYERNYTSSLTPHIFKPLFTKEPNGDQLSCIYACDYAKFNHVAFPYSSPAAYANRPFQNTSSACCLRVCFVLHHRGENCGLKLLYSSFSPITYLHLRMFEMAADL